MWNKELGKGIFINKMREDEIKIWEDFNKLPEVKIALGDWWFIGDKYVNYQGNIYTLNIIDLQKNLMLFGFYLFLILIVLIEV